MLQPGAAKIKINIEKEKCVSSVDHLQFTLLPLVEKFRVLFSFQNILYVCCCCSVAQSCPTLCDPMDCSMPVFPVLYHLPEFAQTRVHWVSDAISSSVTSFSSCPQSFPASESFPMSWLSASGGQSIGASASVLPMNIQDWFPLGLTGLILLSKGHVWAAGYCLPSISFINWKEFECLLYALNISGR